MQQAEIRVRGRVQGVGFRPAVWRLARRLGLSGDVCNDADGVLIRVSGDEAAISGLLERLREEAPRLARIERMDRRAIAWSGASGFRIVASAGGDPRTEIAPDAAICSEWTRRSAGPAMRSPTARNAARGSASSAGYRTTGLPQRWQHSRCVRHAGRNMRSRPTSGSTPRPLRAPRAARACRLTLRRQCACCVTAASSR